MMSLLVLMIMRTMGRLLLDGLMSRGNQGWCESLIFPIPLADRLLVQQDDDRLWTKRWLVNSKSFLTVSSSSGRGCILLSPRPSGPSLVLKHKINQSDSGNSTQFLFQYSPPVDGEESGEPGASSSIRVDGRTSIAGQSSSSIFFTRGQDRGGLGWVW